MKKNWWKFDFKHKCGQESTVLAVFISQEGMRFLFCCVVCGEQWKKDYLHSFFPAKAAIADYTDQQRDFIASPDLQPSCRVN